MKDKGSFGAIGVMLLAFLGFFRRGCDDVIRVADDIPFNRVDDVPFNQMDDVSRAIEEAERFNDTRRFAGKVMSPAPVSEVSSGVSRSLNCSTGSSSWVSP